MTFVYVLEDFSVATDRSRPGSSIGPCRVDRALGDLRRSVRVDPALARKRVEVGSRERELGWMIVWCSRAVLGGVLG